MILSIRVLEQRRDTASPAQFFPLKNSLKKFVLFSRLTPTALVNGPNHDFWANKKKRHLMDNDQRSFLSLRHFPARLSAQQTSWLLGCREHDIPILLAAKVLKPLGDPPDNGVKYVSKEFILERSKDEAWLARV